MAIIKDADILGYVVNGQDVCPKCITPEEKKEATIETLITLEELVVGERCFCDRCEKEM